MYNASCVTRLQITRCFVLGNLLTAFGALLRLRCYKTLGKHFTFELCIHDDHILVDEGPYNVVRHPSYTGLILTILGAYLNHVSGSWVSECGVASAHNGYWGPVIVILWILFSFAVIVSLLLRIPCEDRILMDKFGEVWVVWANRVPYVLIPVIY